MTMSDIPGIGPELFELLAKTSVYVASDLLRTTPRRIHQAIGGKASLAKVTQWRQIASLLQVDQMTAAWADALNRAGIISVEALYLTNPKAILTVMNQARNEELIPTVPTAEQIASMLRDAAVIFHTGCLTGTVVDEERKPVTGATVSMGGVSTTTDHLGRFRLLRLRLAPSAPFHITHPQYSLLTVEHPRVETDSSLVSQQLFRLRKRKGKQSASRALSEARGDKLPAHSGQPVRQRFVEIDQVAEGDVFKLLEVPDSSPDVILVSQLQSYEETEFLVNKVRVARSKLPENARVGDCFRFTDGAFVPTRWDGHRLRRYKVLLQLRQAFGAKPATGTPVELRRDLQARLRFLVEAGYFNFPMRRRKERPL